MDTLFTPFVDYARENVATWLLVLLIFACFIIFPVFFITPSPAIWLAAWLFPLWEAIAIVFAGEQCVTRLYVLYLRFGAPPEHQCMHQCMYFGQYT